MRNKWIGLLITCLFLGCTPKKEQSKILVAIAANIQFPIKEIANQFEEETSTTVDVILGSSGKLATQILQGAPYDIFLSADMKYPENLFEQGLTTTNPKVYAQGQLLLWTMDTELPIQKGLSLLASEKIKRIALPNPKLAPYGRAAEECLKNMGIFETVHPKLVYGENVAQVNQFVLSQAVELGFTSWSVLETPTLENRGHWNRISPATYSPIYQGAVLLKTTSEKPSASAERFFDYLFSSKSKDIFKKYGYLIQS